MKRLLGGLLTGALLAVTSVLGAPQAAAASQASATIPYDCNVPIFGHKTLQLQVSANVPATGVVGQPVQITGVTVVVPIPHDVYDTFTPFGATQVDATLDFELVVGSTHLPVTWFTRAVIPNPPGQDMLFVFSGSVPPYTPSFAGTYAVSAGTNFTMRMTPLDAAGNQTVLGTLDVPGTATGSTFLANINVS